jgi:hypothetical protein
LRIAYQSKIFSGIRGQLNLANLQEICTFDNRHDHKEIIHQASGKCAIAQIFWGNKWSSNFRIKPSIVDDDRCIPKEFGVFSIANGPFLSQPTVQLHLRKTRTPGSSDICISQLLSRGRSKWIRKLEQLDRVKELTLLSFGENVVELQFSYFPV